MLLKKVVAKITGLVKQAEKKPQTIDEEIEKVLEKPAETKTVDKDEENES